MARCQERAINAPTAKPAAAIHSQVGITRSQCINGGRRSLQA